MFEPFPKLARLKRGCVVTEKIDGTNAQVLIMDALGPMAWDESLVVARVGDKLLFAGSRTRMIVPGKLTDNFGFAQWVSDNAEELVKLGEGRHYGEWYGQGIQRNYGLKEKRFALFNTHRPLETLPSCVEQVPILWRGDFGTEYVDASMDYLRSMGSLAVRGFMNPEGIVVYHTASRTAYKRTFEHDEHGKEAAQAA
jgi:hypothetical protein